MAALSFGGRGRVELGYLLRRSLADVQRVIILSSFDESFFSSFSTSHASSQVFTSGEEAVEKEQEETGRP